MADAPNKVLVEFMLWNEQRLVELEEKIKPQFEVLKEKFKTRLTDAIVRQKLPLSIEHLETRLDDIALILCDPAAMRLEEKGGQYLPWRREALIAYRDDAELLEHNVFHELLHHISRQAATKVDISLPGEDADYSYDFSQCGLRAPNGIYAAPQWLNEAFIEQLTVLMLSEDKDVQNIDFSKVTNREFWSPITFVDLPEDHPFRVIYGNEREATEYIGQESRLFVRLALVALFEDTTPGNHGILPANTAMWGSIKEALGDDFINIMYEYQAEKQKGSEIDPMKAFKNFQKAYLERAKSEAAAFQRDLDAFFTRGREERESEI
jgi:hypothetical protein